MARLDKFDRIYQLHSIFSTRRTPISRADLMQRLDGCSEQTVYRLIRFMKDLLRAPIESKRADDGEWQDDPGEFSAVNSRGLIEATTALSQEPRRTSVFRGEQPRPH